MSIRFLTLILTIELLNIIKYTNIGNSVVLMTDCTGFRHFEQNDWNTGIGLIYL